jgi:hypothetical protein
MTRKEKTTRLTNLASVLKGRPKEANQVFFAIECGRGLLLGRTGAGITVNQPGENGVFYWDDKNLN